MTLHVLVRQFRPHLVAMLLAGWLVVVTTILVSGCRGNSGPTIAILVSGIDSEETVAPIRPANPPHKVFISPNDPLSPEGEQAAFTLPDGFEIQLVASEPAIQKPMQLAFDERGRLLVSASKDYPLGPADGEAPSDSVFLLEIDGASGAATRVTTFSTGYTICSGVEALPGGRVILAHAPDILLLSDVDNDGKADESEVLYTGFSRADTHEVPNSFLWGADGWLYGLQGHVNESDVTNNAGEMTPIHHGNVYRMRPDGSEIAVWARGMSNPWGLAFDRNQELFAADCESRPIWQIVEGFAYQGFLQDEEPLGFAPYVTEDPHGASGFAGLVSYTGNAFPAAYRDCLYMGSPITGIIYRDRPEGAGSTKHLTRKPDFLTSTDPWFRPVDVELGPDGALYIADWYNRIIAHVEVPLDHPDRDKERGRIWRIVYRGDGTETGEDRKAIARQFDGPMAKDWSVASQNELMAALSDSNGWIRRQAGSQLDYRFGGEVERPARRLLKRGKSPELSRLEAFWLLARNGELTGRDLAALTGDDSALIRRQAARMSAGRKDMAVADVRQALIALLDDPAPTVAREASLALRQIPDEGSLRALLDRMAVDEGNDELDTLLAYGRGVSVRDHLKEDRILDGIAGEREETAARLIPYLVATPTARAAALQAEWLAKGKIPPDDQHRVLRNVLAHGDRDTVRTVFPQNVSDLPPSGPPLKTYANIVFGSEVKKERGLDLAALYGAWFPLLSESDDPGARQIALDMAAKRTPEDGLDLARSILADNAAEGRSRQTAAQVFLDLRYDEAAAAVRTLVADSTVDPGVRRGLAYELAARAKDPERFDALLGSLLTAPASVYQGAVQSMARHRPTVTYLLDGVERGAINPVYLNDVLVRIFIDDIHKDGALTARHRQLVDAVEDEESRANAQIAKFRARYDANPTRDIARGQRLVEETCLLCHRVGGFGGLRAPNLDGIGNRGIDRLLRDMLQPSRDIDPAFRSTLITRKDGRTEEGFVTREDEEWVVLVDGTGWESEIRKTEIQERKKLWVSPMPPDFGSTLPEEDFLDIVEFLLHPPERVVPLTATWNASATQ